MSQPPFPNHYKEIADDMGISLYQRFSLEEASSFLQCKTEELNTQLNQDEIEYIRLSDDNIQFFGYQLIAYLMTKAIDFNHTTQFNPSNVDRIIRVKETQSMTGLSRSTIYRYEKKGKFPKRISLGTNMTGWKLSEIQNWIAERQ